MARPNEWPIRSVAVTELFEPDDVSALSMTGASVLAARTHAASLQNKTAKGIEKVIPEDDDAENDVANAGEQQRRSSSDMNACRLKSPCQCRRPSLPVLPSKVDAINLGNSLFPDHQSDHVRTFEEWRKSKRKKKHGSKKHHKRDRSKEQIDVVEQDLSPLPINEISFLNNRDPPSIDEYHSSIIPTHQRATSKESQSIASTAASTGSRYQRGDSPPASKVRGSGVVPPGAAAAHTFSSQNLDRPQSNDNPPSFLSHHSRNDDHEGKSDNKSCLQYHSNRDSLAHKSHQSGHDSLDKSCHSVHSFSHSFTSCSHVTVEDIKLIKIELEGAKVEEMKVMELHSKLENDILTLIKQVEELDKQKRIVELKLKSIFVERERLQSCLNESLEENSKLNSVLQNMEEEEETKRVDDVLNKMQSKMRALRLKEFRTGKSQQGS